MKFVKKLSLLFTLSAVLLCCGFASVVSAKTIYFSSQTISFSAVPDPFSEGSKEMTQEISAIIELQKSADEGEVKKASQEIYLQPEMIAQQIDESLNRQKHPKLYILLDHALATSDAVADHIKSKWKMRRPYLVDSRVKALVKPSLNYSYPSGHTTDGYVIAKILGALMPKQAQQFINRAEEIAQHRVLVGMHFQRDLNGGRKLSEAIYRAMKNNKNFQRDFIAAQEELLRN